MNHGMRHLCILVLLGMGVVTGADPPPSEVSITVLVYLAPCEVTITSGPSVDPNVVACGSNGEVQAQVLAEASCATTVSYLWEDDSGGSFDDATSASPVWTAPVNLGVTPLVCTLTVTASADGATPASDTVQVTVDPCSDHVYVDLANASGIEDGLSWATAYTTLQAGLNGASGLGVTNVWVKAGVYNEERFIEVLGGDAGSLIVPAGMSIYGGFDGSETLLSERDWQTNVTAIDGSVSRAGQPTFHVVFLSGAATIDGFTVQGGNAHGSAPGGFELHNVGGGIVVWGGDATIANCTLADSGADFGGGLAVVSGNAAVTDSIVDGNSADYGSGGLFSFNSTMSVTGTDFTNNTGNYSGAVEVWSHSPTFDTCTFTGNSGVYGGAVFAWNSTPDFSKCSFVNNVATLGAGAAFNYEASVSFDACVFDLNEGVYGGTLSNWSCTPSLVNCLITNSTGYLGGAMFNINCGTTLLNCTLADSISATSGGALYNIDSAPLLTNCILWNDSPNEIGESGVGTTTAAYSNIQGGWPGTGNAATGPLFASGGYELQAGSPCVDTADLPSAPPVDLLGVTRPQGGGVDRGAFESH